MNHFSLELSLIAVLPALFLCGYVFYKDKIEKEPIGLLALLFAVGAVSYIPTYFLQELIISLIDGAFKDKITASPEGLLTYASSGDEILHLALCSFIGFSLIRVFVIWAALFLVTRKNKNFNFLFDGIVYSVFISLGFAVSENLHFVLQNDLEMLIPKLLTSVPCSLFIGILMGYYYTMWHMRFVANSIESDLLKAEVIKKDNIRSSAPWLICSLIIPFIINGVYVLAGSINGSVITFIFYALIFILFGISFVAINQIAEKDTAYGRYLYRIIAKGHPELSAEKIESVINAQIGEKEGENE